ncbi:hypothetical protein [Sulfolobus spindle-shaped virus]|nr:hypothetical protein [Sulfolobus spindle-shaped virus]AZG03220.1 hypothetical protein [Sulfolobus spindle-shaped virus]AZG03243.1 hypothetical protein [Sulfolobus spindle-shaped virus]AZG03279.1 hypothetical protein [Sulfolobus spindle-shaped virus]AZG03321.1 hypothetical protein [Sulfolobus spindle-shaped virus]
MVINEMKDNGFQSILVFGKQGAGKTTYALKVGTRILQYLYPDLTEHDAWWQAYNLMVFTLDEAIEKLMSVVEMHEKGNVNYRLPFLIIDDASIDLIKYAWREEQNIQFAKLNNLARTWSVALIFTTPWIEDIQKFLREKAWIVVQVQKYGSSKNGDYPKSIAWIYKRTIKLIDGEFKGKYVEKYYDIFRREMPNDLYEEYIKRRDGVMKRIANEVLAIMREKSSKLPST